MSGPSENEDDIVAAIRRIIRAIDLHSRRLLESHKLTGPQLATMRAAQKMRAAQEIDGPTTSALARAVHLSQPTVSGILNRLERQGLIRRERSQGDRRSVVIRVTDEGEKVLEEAPSLLQERFRAKLGRLEDWERHWLLAALERIASMMDADAIDAAPILETGQISQSVEEEAPETERFPSSEDD
ncbi:MAG TPA: MarR family transcriptional regulator [Myxococcota bacterium]|nr:MarR family transcriptional regulator [Myxococcota bacterium]